MKTGIIITIVVVAVIVLGLIVFGIMQMSYPTANSNPSSTNQQNSVVSSGNSNVAKTYTVAISNFAFSPSTVTIHAGDSVTWANQDSVAHTIVSDNGNELNSNSIPNGGSYSHTFATPGTYDYHCSIHPSMKGQIIVQ